MKKSNIIKLICAAVVTVLSVAAIILSSIAIATRDDMKILTAYQIGLSDFLSGEVTQMYADEGSNPDWCDNFSDDDILSQTRSALKTSIYQKTSAPNGNGDGSGEIPYVTFYTADSYYSFGYCGASVLVVNIGGEKSYYASDGMNEIISVINQAVELVK